MPKPIRDIRDIWASMTDPVDRAHVALLAAVPELRAAADPIAKRWDIDVDTLIAAACRCPRPAADRMQSMPANSGGTATDNREPIIW